MLFPVRGVTHIMSSRCRCDHWSPFSVTLTLWIVNGSSSWLLILSRELLMCNVITSVSRPHRKVHQTMISIWIFVHIRWLMCRLRVIDQTNRVLLLHFEPGIFDIIMFSSSVVLFISIRSPRRTFCSSHLPITKLRPGYRTSMVEHYTHWSPVPTCNLTFLSLINFYPFRCTVGLWPPRVLSIVD